jgi:hypothetical protein
VASNDGCCKFDRGRIAAHHRIGATCPRWRQSIEVPRRRCIERYCCQQKVTYVAAYLFCDRDGRVVRVVVSTTTRKHKMLVGKLPTIAITVVAICLCDGAFAADGGRPRHTAPQTARWSRPAMTFKSSVHTAHWRQRVARDPYADPAAPYRADRLASQPGQRIINIPGQTTVLTRQVLDDKNATSGRDALRTTPGVTIGR